MRTQSVDLAWNDPIRSLFIFIRIFNFAEKRKKIKYIFEYYSYSIQLEIRNIHIQLNTVFRKIIHSNTGFCIQIGATTIPKYGIVFLVRNHI